MFRAFFEGDSLIKPPFRVTLADVPIIWPDLVFLIDIFRKSQKIALLILEGSCEENLFGYLAVTSMFMKILPIFPPIKAILSRNSWVSQWRLLLVVIFATWLLKRPHLQQDNHHGNFGIKALTSWWLNQPTWKILVKMGSSSPDRGEH